MTIMSPIDSLAEWYRLKALRSLPRAHPIEGPYTERQGTSAGEWAVMIATGVLWALIVFGVLE